MANAEDIFREFVRQINNQNVEGLCDLMSDDHKFVDSLGATVTGREAMRNGWKGYFGIVPDYSISLDEIMVNDNIVAAFGHAGGTFSMDGELKEENKWQVPAAWVAVINEAMVSEWRVYADNEPIRQLIAKAGQK